MGWSIMQKITLRYDNNTNRITQTYWGDDTPEWANNEKTGTTTTTTETSAVKRENKLRSALNDVESGTDYDPDTERPVPRLCYNPNVDKLYAEVDIQPLNE